ncbi:MAG: hypothetical protein IKY23_10405 [Lachnospiraceae bacterium]|nr:hypothetical protein [Lachnospiraceae bacterium]
MGAMQNYGGVKAAERENDYSKRLEGIDKEHKVENPFWATSKANLILVPIFSFMDGIVIHSITDACLTQSALMGYVMAFGIAIVLNMLPLIIAKFAHQAIYKTKRHAVTMMIICIIGFLLIFTGTVLLRFAYSDMYETESQSAQLENTVSNEEIIESEENEDSKNKSIAVVMLLSLSPLVTSIIGFGIAFVSDDEVRKRFEYHERRDVELDEAISDIEAAIETMNSDVERDLRLDETSMNAAIDEIRARANVLKALARHYLAEYLADPAATSKLSAEMRIANEDNRIFMNEEVKELDGASFKVEGVA